MKGGGGEGSDVGGARRSSVGDRRRPWEGVAAVLGHCRIRLVVTWAGGVVCGRGELFWGGGHRL